MLSPAAGPGTSIQIILAICHAIATTSSRLTHGGNTLLISRQHLAAVDTGEIRPIGFADHDSPGRLVHLILGTNAATQDTG